MLRWMQSINAKFFGIFFLMTVILLGSKLFHYTTLVAAQAKAQQTMARELESMVLADRIATSMFSVQNWETYLQSPEVIEDIIAKALQDVETLQKRQTFFDNADNAKLIETSITNVTNFRETFLQTIQAFKNKGFDPNSGQYGTTRQAAHNLEALLHTVEDELFRYKLDSAYLMARRHEKDYLSRLNDHYIIKFKAVLRHMDVIVQSSELTQPIKDDLIAAIERYKGEFLDLVVHTTFVAKQKEDMRLKAQEVQALMVKVSEQGKERLEQKFTSIWEGLTAWIKEGLFFSALVLLLGVVVVWNIVNRTISRPLIHLKHLVTTQDQKQVHWEKEWESEGKRPDEIGALAIAFQTMIGDLHRHSVALSEAKTYTDNILLSMMDTLLVVNDTGTVLRVNRFDLLGYGEEEQAGFNVEKLFVEEQGKLLGGSWTRLSDNANTETFLLRKDGMWVPVLVSGSRMLDPLVGERVHILVVRDITPMVNFQKELQAARQKAENASQLKSLFVANMSHEIRTPMNAILGLTHLCLQTETTIQQTDYLDKIYHSAHALLYIIDDILDFSKIEAGKLTVETISFHLGDVLSDLSILTTAKTQGKDVEVVFVTARGVPRILLGDPTRIGQVLTNLANNAAKFTESGEIILSISRLDQREEGVTLQFSIRDTGIGMTEAQMGRLFHAFSQADDGTTRKYGGTGLGLTISKRLVELMGGSIWVESSPGKGSTFSFRLWFDLPKNSRQMAMQLPDSLLKKRVLVVDDNQSSQTMLSAALESFSFQVTTASSGMEGLIKLEKMNQEGKPFDLLLLDWRMPGLDGVQTFHCLKSLGTAFVLPTLFMVPHIQQADIRMQMDDVQPEAYLDKPVHISALFDAIMTLFGQQGLLPVVESKEKAHLLKPGKQVAGAKVLLVEDNEINQQVGKELLEIAGIVVEIAQDGQEAIRKVSQQLFDLILMDIQMPVMDGHQATRIIRTMPNYKTLPIVAMTANVMVQDLALCWESGMDGHIAKPIDPSKLYRVLHKWIKPQEGISAQPSEGSEASHPEMEMAPLPVESERQKPGIQMALGLSHVGGNMTLYRSLLEKFLHDYTNFMAEMQQTLAEKDTYKARRLAHTLKGVAGTLGALRLQGMARTLESSLVPTEALAEELTSVLTIIQQLQTSAKMEGDGQALAALSPEIDIDALLQLFQALIPQVEKKRPKNCQALLLKLEGMAFPASLESQRHDLVKFIQKYKMREARVVLATLVGQLTALAKGQSDHV